MMNINLITRQSFRIGARRFIPVIAAGLLLNACGATNPPKLSLGHITSTNIEQESKGIPPVLAQVPKLPAPKLTPKLETYTVVVADTPVKDLLFSLSRDANLNVDISTDVTGNVTLNAVDQTLPQLLERITKQVSLRYVIDGPNLVISSDTPFWRIYRIDYVNIARESISEAKVATQIATTGGAGGSTSGNGSKTTVKNKSTNNFWAVLQANIRAILGVTSATIASATSAAASSATPPAATAAAPGTIATTGDGTQTTAVTTPSITTAPILNPVVANPAAGLINIFATQHQHQELQKFLDQVMVNAQRQVLIEMTIVEVELSDHFQAGVDWTRLSDNNQTGGNGPSLIANLTGTTNLSTTPVFTIGYQNSTSSIGNVTATIKMLETFGTVRVLSSPKIMALNNQTALLKVVDESVYFTVEQETTTASVGVPAIITFTSEVHTVPVGMVMSVMPQINENDNVTLSIRPTISRITSFKEDPVPKLVGANFENLVPQIQVREMESLLQVGNGQTIVMGGLMQNKINKNKDGIPILQNIPIIGNLFSYRNDLLTKTELIIFLRPTVIKSSDMQGKWRGYKHLLPDNALHMPTSRHARTKVLANSNDQVISQKRSWVE